MPLDLDVDYIVSEYRSGRSQQSIADELGVSTGSIRRRLVAREVEIRSAAEARRVEIPNIDQLAQRYEHGETLQALASEIDASRQALRSRLEDRGVNIRSESEARELAWEKIKAEGRTEDFVEPAHQGRRGQTLDEEEKVNRARGVQRAAQQGNYPLGKHEERLASILISQGLNVTKQCAVHTYNIDIAIDSRSIAVEVLGRPLNRKARRLFRDRMECLFCRDWGVAYVTAYEWRSVDLRAISEQIITLSQSGNGHIPAINGRYWVIGSQGDFISFAGRDLDDLASIITPEDASA